MTGFGRGTAERDGVRLEVELKGVNHRFLDLKLKLPPEMGTVEAALRARVQEVSGRGRIDLSVSLASRRPPVCRVEVNRPFIAGYLEAAAALKKEFRLRGSIGLDALVAIPGALTIQAEERDPDGVASSLLWLALDQALGAFDSMRTEEGARLAADLATRLRLVEEAVGLIERESQGLPEAYARRLRDRIAALVQERGLDDVRLAQEVALMADRVDTTEELVRLKGYLEQARGALERPEGPIGKTLDFIMQEMNREANTISSKAEALPICQAALRIKSEIEKMREQIQNLE
ncbi:MAG TPA: YicC/YloC family endoribonuclease [Candidatus Polarisedimenticolia bacterium]|nr:YicC/YloC family endoribonuclease [Candidatus Polarisedimenticolia bacterium]